MAANMNTIRAIEAMQVLFAGKSFTPAQWDKNAAVRFSTAKKYANLVEVKEVRRVYYSMAELVQELNACAGNDCYACDWNYEIDEQGRAYQDFESVSYHFA
jgi:hypothetical protein